MNPALGLTLGDFSKALRKAGVLDNQALDFAGGYVLLPYGVELMQRFRELVHAEYRRIGLSEYEYPGLVPMACLNPTAQLFDLSGKLLRIERNAAGQELAMLPTGEGAIYSHWRRVVRARSDLPIRMYRRARYYRPMPTTRQAGRGVLQSIENEDIFEFHCAFATREEQEQELENGRSLLETVVRKSRVPVIWSRRPIWTNRREVAEWALAADAPLPVQATAQVASLYNQGDRFSVPYQIGFRENGKMSHTQHVTGYVSRRLLLAHLMNGMRPDGSLFIHPDFAPAQVAVLSSEQSCGEEVEGILRNAGLRVAVTAGRLKQLIPMAARQGVPLIVAVFPPRHEGDALRAVMRRSDTGEETEVRCLNWLELCGPCLQAVREIGDAYEQRVNEFFKSRLRQADAGTVREIVAQHYVAVCALEESEEAVQAVAAWKHGEVLGYRQVPEMKPCVITGKLVDTQAYISPRL